MYSNAIFVFYIFISVQIIFYLLLLFPNSILLKATKLTKKVIIKRFLRYSFYSLVAVVSVYAILTGIYF
jgi:hypothetical protein